MKKLFFIACIVLFASCGGNDDDTVVIPTPTTPGASFSLSSKSFSETYNDLRDALQANQNISIIAEVNHTANAAAVGLTLNNSRLIIFGNPALGTPLMQINQRAGLDLPQKMLVYEDDQANIFVAYNGTSYLATRHNVGNATTLQQISTALSNFATAATDGTVSENTNTGISFNEGVITLVSQNDFGVTYNKLRNAISDDPNLSIISEVNHQANGQSVGIDIFPTRLIVFGNASVGTPLIEASNTTALDLPQKMLVWEEADGTVNISYNNPDYLEFRHAITGQETLLNSISSALAGLAVDASN